MDLISFCSRKNLIFSFQKLEKEKEKFKLFVNKIMCNVPNNDQVLILDDFKFSQNDKASYKFSENNEVPFKFFQSSTNDQRFILSIVTKNYSSKVYFLKYDFYLSNSSKSKEIVEKMQKSKSIIQKIFYPKKNLPKTNFCEFKFFNSQILFDNLILEIRESEEHLLIGTSNDLKIYCHIDKKSGDFFDPEKTKQIAPLFQFKFLYKNDFFYDLKIFSRDFQSKFFFKNFDFFYNKKNRKIRESKEISKLESYSSFKKDEEIQKLKKKISSLKNDLKKKDNEILDLRKRNNVLFLFL